MRIVNPIAILGENFAVAYLQKKGFKVLERNYRKRYGEIDIIAMKSNTLIFVEVKTRTNNAFGSPLEAITYGKLRQLVKTAEYYKLLHPKLPEAMRIDAISILLNPKNEIDTIEHIENITI